MINRFSFYLIALAVILLVLKEFYVYVPYLWGHMRKWTVIEWFYFLQTVIFFVSAVIAYHTIRSSKEMAKEKSTLETILADNKDPAFVSAKNRLHFYIEKIQVDGQEKSLASICEMEEASLKAQELDIKRDLLLVLNRHEFYAIGINTRLFDEQLFKRMHCSNFLKLWKRVEPAVTQLRNKSQKTTLFRDFEILVQKWQKNMLQIEDIQIKK